MPRLEANSETSPYEDEIEKHKREQQEIRRRQLAEHELNMEDIARRHEEAMADLAKQAEAQQEQFRKTQQEREAILAQCPRTQQGEVWSSKFGSASSELLSSLERLKQLIEIPQLFTNEQQQQLLKINLQNFENFWNNEQFIITEPSLTEEQLKNSKLKIYIIQLRNANQSAEEHNRNIAQSKELLIAILLKLYPNKNCSPPYFATIGTSNALKVLEESGREAYNK